MTDRLSLALIDGPASFRPETRRIDGFEYTLGRGTDTNWTLSDPERNVLSRRHCQLSIEDGDWWVTDLSGNGTFLNADPDPIGEHMRRRLRDGDRIRIGGYVFQVQLAPAGPSLANPDLISPTEGNPVSGRVGGDWVRRPGLREDNPFDDVLSEAEPPVRRTPPVAPPVPPASSRRDGGGNPFDAEAPPASPAALRPRRDGAVRNPFDDADDGDDARSGEPILPPPEPVGGSGVNPFDEPEPSALLPLPSAGAVNAGERAIAPPWPDVDEAAADSLPEPALHAPPHAVAPPVIAPPVDSPPVAPAPPAVSQPTAVADTLPLLDALLRGAGLPDARPKDPEQALHALGAAFRAMVVGLRHVQRARRTIRGEFRIAQTTWTTNPLKVAVSDEDAMEALVGAGRRSSMPPAKAVEEVLSEIVAHEMAIMAAMQQAVRTLLASLAPDRVREAADQGGGLAVLPAQRKARAWDAYEALHARVTDALDDDFESVFGRAFARAYERVAAGEDGDS